MIWAVVLDQGTKLWAARTAGKGVEVLDNPRYALGVLGGSAPAMILGTVAVLTVFALVIVPLAYRVGLPAWIPGLVFGGALSNLIDRVRFGAVRDFITTDVAIVNVADLIVLAGVLMIPALLLLRTRRAALEPVRA